MGIVVPSHHRRRPHAHRGRHTHEGKAVASPSAGRIETKCCGGGIGALDPDIAEAGIHSERGLDDVREIDDRLIHVNCCRRERSRRRTVEAVELERGVPACRASNPQVRHPEGAGRPRPATGGRDHDVGRDHVDGATDRARGERDLRGEQKTYSKHKTTGHLFNLLAAQVGTADVNLSFPEVGSLMQMHQMRRARSCTAA